MGMAERRAKCAQLVRRYYADVPLEGSVRNEVISPLLQASVLLLDAGSGASCELLRQYGPYTRFSVGVDVVLPREQLPPRTAMTVGQLAALPFTSEVFDVIVSRAVMEHLPHPLPVFQELYRILKTGGKLILTTPNRYCTGVGAIVDGEMVVARIAQNPV